MINTQLLRINFTVLCALSMVGIPHRLALQDLRQSFGADDRARTGDLNLGKVALYQLSYVRVGL